MSTFIPISGEGFTRQSTAKCLPIHSLNHISRETRDPERLRNFYMNVLGFIPMNRPKFEFGGFWLCLPSEYNNTTYESHTFDKNLLPSPGSILLHIIEKDEKEMVPESPISSSQSLVSTTYPTRPIAIRRGHHLAFRTESIEIVEERLKKFNIFYQTNFVPGTSAKQCFFFDCDGNGIEIGNFSFLQPALLKEGISSDDLAIKKSDKLDFSTLIPNNHLPAYCCSSPSLYKPLLPSKSSIVSNILSNLNVSISGGSIAGLCACLALHRIGVNVTVYERGSRLRRRGGGGIGLEDASRAVLMALDVFQSVEGSSKEDAKRELMLPMRYHQDRSSDGKIIRKGIIPFWSGHWQGVYNILLDSLPENLVKFKMEFESFMESKGCIDVKFKNGETIKTDVLVGADGSLSKIREIMFGDELIRDAGYFAWRGQVNMEACDEKFLDDIKKYFVEDTLHFEMLINAHAVVYTVPGNKINWLLYMQKPECVNSDGEKYIRKSDLKVALTVDATEEEVKSLHEFVKKNCHPILSELILRTEVPFKNDILDRDPLPSFHQGGRAIIIGDAAHPCTPHYVRGSNMAIQDGYWLAKTLQETVIKILPYNNCSSKEEVSLLIQKWFNAFDCMRVQDTANVILTARRLGKIKNGVYDINELQKDRENWMKEISGDKFFEICKDGIDSV